MERSTDLQITHILHGLLLQPQRQENSTQDSVKCHQEGWFLFVGGGVKRMCTRESRKTKKLACFMKEKLLASS